MSGEILNKLRMQKKFRNLKTIQKLLENSTQLEEYLTGQAQPLTDTIDSLPANGFIHVDKDLHYLFETDPAKNATRVTEIRSGDIRLSEVIDDNFFYQHMFNFALVIILLLQVIVVWAFIWCRLSKYGNQPINSSHSHAHVEDGIALRDIAQLPEVIPRQQRGELDEREGNQGNAQGGIVAANRCGRFG